MSIKLFILRNVPDDEAEEIRELLENNNIDYYETSAGNWGISMPAIWLKDEQQLSTAKLLIKQYQEESLAKARKEYEKQLKEGRNRTVIDVIKEEPIRFIIYLTIVLVVIYLSTMPFVTIGE